MSIALNIKAFLSSKFTELKIKRKDFTKGSGIPASVLSGFLNAVRMTPTLTNIIKVADYFNCSIDEVLGRQEYFSSEEEYVFNKIGLYDIADNIRSYITSELVKRDIDAKSLSMLPGIGSDTILKFLKEEDKKKGISTKTVIAIANYFNVSIDEMIGRVDKDYKSNK